MATFRPHTAGPHQAIVAIYWVELFVPPWLLVIGVSQTSLMVGGFRSHHDIKTINIARVDVIEEKLKTASNLYPLSSLAIISLRMAEWTYR